MSSEQAAVGKSVCYSMPWGPSSYHRFPALVAYLHPDGPVDLVYFDVAGSRNVQFAYRVRHSSAGEVSAAFWEWP